MEILKKSFNDCDLAYLEKTFGLRQVWQMSAMQDWQQRAKNKDVSEKERLCLEIFQDLLAINSSWNEQELSLHFVGPLFGLVGFTEPYRFNLFAERMISATVPNIYDEPVLLSGKPDEFIASGYREPEIPFFCFQEFKREKDPNGDPTAQALAAMLAGQVLNQNLYPMYGCYIVGRAWYFMTLIGKEYYITDSLNTTNNDIIEVFQLLKALKEIIKERTS